MSESKQTAAVEPRIFREIDKRMILLRGWLHKAEQEHEEKASRLTELHARIAELDHLTALLKEPAQ